ncbi:glycyl-tRNA synthetase beta chain [Actinokineospora alba]|uniref:Multifunctional fusion protein n=2 Tax=Actinokineospora alba TaxID=504798 RepID=A0A1H0H929_9PSEU|nr:glycyl-tRNA synthetase beta chain [Actinokineospora alba]SDH51433.1 glycyl-tRNA synthetase beta chain [Actinokineospora alba]SDO15411.1 glycyl-tRNA synthetase beta chain [Actinokineospora alba]
MLTMQDALLALTKYWTERGAMVVQPFNTEVGAGTLNPATILRVLGPEPWRVAYVEPSVRPDDSRYGENPNRLQTHTQFQVVLKPDPGNPQELFLESLTALGIDIHAHDIRFVEDNWANPATGSWGLGWEVWLDGLEITQFTYFQQAGGMTLDPVSVEITYGVERIMMALQGVDHFANLAYAPGISYGEAFGQAEYEMSRFYLDDADVDSQRTLFEEYAAEARRLLDARLPVPAHLHVLKCSHTFNILDARGAVSTTERAKAFARMRGLAREVAALWAERRTELGHPLGTAEVPAAAPAPTEFAEVSGEHTLLFEIGTEELPPHEVTRTAESVRRALTEKLAATRLVHGDITTYATPRRVVAVVDGVSDREPDAERTVRGPRESAAFDADGNPTKAAAGFARGQGVDPATLQRVDVDGVTYVGITKTDIGRGAVEVLSGILGEVVSELRSDKNMRWNDPKLSFTRPVRWLVALLGDTPVPVVASALVAGSTTRVHRTAAQSEVAVASAADYPAFLASHGIVVDQAERRAQIIAAARELAATVGGTIDVDGESALLDEITNLVEEPNPLLGSFEERYLDLPAEILTTVMRKHQRYLPVRAASGELLPHFVAVANGSCDHDKVRAGNEAVLRARYEDAAFFWRADLETPLDKMKAGIAKLAFEEKLGSVAERASRIGAVAQELARGVDLSEKDTETLARAAALAKFDLGSQMVIELTSLAGTMAREYARRSGETEAVAQALFDMELPRGGGGAVPSTVPGALLALADRFDLLAGLFAIGAKPTGSSDPFGLRRAAAGVVAILRAHPVLRPISIPAGLAAAADRVRAQGIEVSDAVLADVAEFVVKRYEQHLLDAGNAHDLVAAVIPLAHAPAAADETLTELSARVTDPDFAALAAALQRVRRIVPADTASSYDPAALVEPAELALHEAFVKARSAGSDLAAFVESASVLTAPVNTFFDEILVMAEDPAIRAARLGLLASIRDLAAPVLDWQALTTSLEG